MRLGTLVIVLAALLSLDAVLERTADAPPPPKARAVPCGRASCDCGCAAGGGCVRCAAP